jgi:SAM-dependent methyltransferase
MNYDKGYYKSTMGYASNQRILSEVYKTVMFYEPKSVLDVGCGMGHLVKMFLDNGIKATGIDGSPDAGELIKDNFTVWDARKEFPFEDKTFDICVSKDFFEHLAEDEIDFTYNEMKRVSNKVMALISFKYDRDCGTHKTIKKLGWWQEKLSGCQIL